jgi:predicted RNA-binding Zn-ribbon protein involved in translation (DUF1610 family)
METPCPNCGKRLRTAVVNVGAFRVLRWSCDGEEITRCPRCGTELPGNAASSGARTKRGAADP